MPMGMAPAAYVLWMEFMRFDPRRPDWTNRDRFLLSAGHGSMLQYALLHLCGYESMTARTTLCSLCSMLRTIGMTRTLHYSQTCT